MGNSLVCNVTVQLEMASFSKVTQAAPFPLISSSKVTAKTNNEALLKLMVIIKLI